MWKGIVCLLVLLLCGCGAKMQSLTERFSNDPVLLLEQFDTYSSIAEPKTYAIIAELEIYGASGKHYYINSDPTEDEIMFTSGLQKKKYCYFMVEVKDIILGYLINNGIIIQRTDIAFVKDAFAMMSDEEIEAFFYKLVGVACYILTNEDILMLDFYDEIDNFMDFKEAWDKRTREVSNPIQEKRLEEAYAKIKGLK